MSPSSACRGCRVVRVRHTSKTGLCQRCRQRATCLICHAVCGRGNICPDCSAACQSIVAAHAADSRSRPPAGQRSARLAYFRARAALGLDLFPVPDPLPPAW